MVYLKELDARGGFVVYSNFGTSRKAKDLRSNPYASLTFWWEALQRQVRVEGPARRLEAEESQVYFDTRVRGSRIGAWASRQSQVLEPRRAVEDASKGISSEKMASVDVGEQNESVEKVESGVGSVAVVDAEGREGFAEDDGRLQLEEWVREREEQFAGVEKIPVPEFWGGLRIVPERVEFWQGRENRLHDRFEYVREAGVEGRDGGKPNTEDGGKSSEEGWILRRLSP